MPSSIAVRWIHSHKLAGRLCLRAVQLSGWRVDCVYELGNNTCKRGFWMSCDHKEY